MEVLYFPLIRGMAVQQYQHHLPSLLHTSWSIVWKCHCIHTRVSLDLLERTTTDADLIVCICRALSETEKAKLRGSQRGVHQSGIKGQNANQVTTVIQLRSYDLTNLSLVVNCLLTVISYQPQRCDGIVLPCRSSHTLLVEGLGLPKSQTQQK